ncbi:MAG: glycosyltransferase family 9 protein [Candidatus Omnitrophota bacterium]
MKKFLIINPFGIGDVLFTTPVIRSIKENFPKGQVGYWCNERVGAILEDNPCIDKVFALSRGDLKRISGYSRIQGLRRSWGLFSAIKKERFDISLDFSLEHRYSLISKLAGIKRRVGFNYKKRGKFLTESLEVLGYQDKHVVEYYLGLLDFIGVKPAADLRLELFIAQEAKFKVEALFLDLGINNKGPLIGIAPGAGGSWGKDAGYKHWSAEKFAQVTDKISKDFGSKVLILGDGKERQLAERIVKASSGKPFDLTGKISLKELAAVIERLDLLIANDGGPLHMAVALGVKTVSIFGPVDERVYGPYPASDRHIVIKKDLDCRPCYQDFRFKGCDNNRLCLEGIDVNEVYERARSLML